MKIDNTHSNVYEASEFDVKLLDKLSMEACSEYIIEARKELNPDQPWAKLKVKLTDEEDVIRLYGNAVKYAINARDDFSRFLSRMSSGTGKVLIDIKSSKSFVDKVVKRGKKISQIHDLLRGAILANDLKHLDAINKNIRKKAIIHEVEFKAPGNDSFGYFGSYHYKIVINGLIVEIQVMTRKLWTYKEEAHKIYDTYRSIKSFDSITKKQDTAFSRKLFKIGNTNTAKPT